MSDLCDFFLFLQSKKKKDVRPLSVVIQFLPGVVFKGEVCPFLMLHSQKVLTLSLGCFKNISLFV